MYLGMGMVNYSIGISLVLRKLINDSGSSEISCWSSLNSLEIWWERSLSTVYVKEISPYITL